MIAVDTSAIVAAALGEPEAGAFKHVLAETPLLIGWATVLELRRVLAAKGFAHAALIVDELLQAPNLTAVSFDAAHYRAAEEALRRFGKGTGHPAALNLGDCFAYAVAKVAGVPLLFKGNDFGHTDVKAHPESRGG